MPQGPIATTSATNQSNQAAPGKLGFQSEQWTSSRHGRNYAAALAGTIGFAASQAGTTTSAGLATTYTGLCLSNPAASGKNLAVLMVAGSFIVAPSTITGINMITGYAAGGITVHTTSLTVQTGIIGVAPTVALVGLADGACTLVGTPRYSLPLGQAATATTSPFFSLDVGGSLIIPPGGYVAIGTTIASPASGFMGSILWEEIVV